MNLLDFRILLPRHSDISGSLTVVMLERVMRLELKHTTVFET